MFCRVYKAALFIIGLFIFSIAVAEEKQSLSAWLKDLKLEAKDNGISPKTINRMFKNAKYLPRVIALDRAQPEFILPFRSYVEARVSSANVEQGRKMLQIHDALLTQVEAGYRVPKNVLVAFWGMETHFGDYQGDFELPSALMTLAYEGRRAEFFRTQLLDAMRVVDVGYSKVKGLHGSWAGAMGHMQFMPSTLLKYGVDADEDGRIDITKSLPDAFASAANYLSSVGWRINEPIAIEVMLPEDFEYQQAQLLNRKNASEWSKLGVRDMAGSALPALDNTAILLPQGWQGPAFLVAANFDAVMDWNRSVNYALSVSHFAQQLLADKPILGGAEAENTALTFNQIWALQGKLNELGFNCGAPDGFPGLKMQSAIRQYQATHKLPQDGYASASLYQRLLQP